jgi:TPR repeat protein
MPYDMGKCSLYIEKMSLTPLDSVKKLEPEFEWYLTDYLKLGHLHFQKMEYEQAVGLYRKAVEKGQNEAWMALAICFQRGLGCEKNMETALSYYNKFFECRLSENLNQMNLGDAGENGEKAGENEKKAWKTEDLVNNHFEYVDLVEHLKKDNLQKSDNEKIFGYFQILFEKDCAAAVMETLSKGNRDLLARAIECFEVTASSEVSVSGYEACYYLGLCYAKGYGEKKNPAAAQAWFEQYEKRFISDEEICKKKFYAQKKNWSYYIEYAAHGMPYYILNSSYMDAYAEIVNGLKDMTSPEKKRRVFIQFRFFLTINQAENVMDTLKRANPELISNAVSCFVYNASTGKPDMFMVEACYYLGMCYAKGYGREQDIAYAKTWFAHYDKRFDQYYQGIEKVLRRTKKEWKQYLS